MKVEPSNQLVSDAAVRVVEDPVHTESRDHILGVQRVLVLYEAEAIHQFDLDDLTSAMAVEVIFNVLLGG